MEYTATYRVNTTTGAAAALPSSATDGMTEAKFLFTTILSYFPPLIGAKRQRNGPVIIVAASSSAFAGSLAILLLMGLAQRNLVIIFPGTVQRPTSSTSRLRLLFYVDTVVIARGWPDDDSGGLSMPTNLLIIGKRNKNRTKVATINVRYDVDDGPRNINYINDCIQSGILNRSKIDFQSPSLPSSSPVLIDLRSGVRPSVQVCGRSREGNDEPNDINGHFDTNLSDTWYKNRKMDIRTTST